MHGYILTYSRFSTDGSVPHCGVKKKKRGGGRGEEEEAEEEEEEEAEN